MLPSTADRVKREEPELASFSVSTILAEGNQNEAMIRAKERDFAVAKCDIRKKEKSRPIKNELFI